MNLIQLLKWYFAILFFQSLLRNKQDKPIVISNIFRNSINVVIDNIKFFKFKSLHKNLTFPPTCCSTCPLNDVLVVFCMLIDCSLDDCMWNCSVYKDWNEMLDDVLRKRFRFFKNIQNISNLKWTICISMKHIEMWETIICYFIL